MHMGTDCRKCGDQSCRNKWWILQLFVEILRNATRICLDCGSIARWCTGGTANLVCTWARTGQNSMEFLLAGSIPYFIRGITGCRVLGIALNPTHDTMPQIRTRYTRFHCAFENSFTTSVVQSMHISNCSPCCRRLQLKFSKYVLSDQARLANGYQKFWISTAIEKWTAISTKLTPITAKFASAYACLYVIDTTDTGVDTCVASQKPATDTHKPAGHHTTTSTLVKQQETKTNAYDKVMWQLSNHHEMYTKCKDRLHCMADLQTCVSQDSDLEFFCHSFFPL